jgi:hypothetical protein
VDACGRKFVVNDGEVNAVAISLFGRRSSSVQSPDSPPFPVSDSDPGRRSLSLLFRRLWNSFLEGESLFAGPRGCVRSLPDSVSLLSVEAFDCLLSDVTFCIESEDALFELIIGLGPDYFRLLRHVRWDRLTGSLPPAFEEAAWVAPDDALWAGVSGLVRKALDLSDHRPLLAPTRFASLIVAYFPAVLGEFCRKRFTLLWRGSRDGFGARDFHGRCDGQAPTLTLIQDTNENIFGGFTPIEWESEGLGRFKTDPSLKSFLFTLKNPHNLPARKFALKTEQLEKAIDCDSKWGPHFSAIGVSDHCNANTNSYSYLGFTYANDTGLDDTVVLTGSFYFTVKEIEVFQVAD